MQPGQRRSSASFVANSISFMQWIRLSKKAYLASRATIDCMARRPATSAMSTTIRIRTTNFIRLQQLCSERPTYCLFNNKQMSTDAARFETLTQRGRNQRHSRSRLSVSLRDTVRDAPA